MDGPHRPHDAPHSVSTSSSRITRSAARLAADAQSTSSEAPTIAETTPAPAPTRKRKASNPDPQPAPAPSSRRRSNKKAKVAEPPANNPPPSSSLPRRPKSRAAMASNDGDNTRRAASSRRRQQSPPAAAGDTSPPPMPSLASSRRKSSRKSGGTSTNVSSSASSGKSNKRSNQNKDPEVQESSLRELADMDDDEELGDAELERVLQGAAGSGNHMPEDGDEDDDDGGRMDEDDPFTNTLLGRMAGSSSIANTLRTLGGMMSGVTGRMRGILANLRAKDDPSIQLIALTELSELLLISNEDNLAGHFSPDQFVKELIELMQPNEFGMDNPEMMLLACRCIANLLEAVPNSTASVVYGGAVPVLCQKLVEIEFIDLAEQALSTLEKISVEFPGSIVREGGLTACLTYLDFFATSTQRTAVTTAANCCRGLHDESFETVRDVMPSLLNVLGSNDQKVVEQGSLCVCRIIESFNRRDERLEALVSQDLLKAILRLLLPGTTNLIGANIHTQFLRTLAIAARASPRISVELLRLHVVDTLYQILTGISPPSGFDNIAAQIDKNVIMQALIRSPKDQIFETLNVVCEILPPVPDLIEPEDQTKPGLPITRSHSSGNDKRSKLFRESREEVRRFAIILFPTLMHAYTSTVNLNVRQKVLSAQLKMLHNFDTGILDEALVDIPFASHIASILTQQENPLLSLAALTIADLLITRLDHIYRFKFYREGVIPEIRKLAEQPLSTEKSQADVAAEDVKVVEPAPNVSADTTHIGDESDHPDDMDSGDEDDDEGAEDDHDDDMSDSESETAKPAQIVSSQSHPGIEDLLIQQARSFVQNVLATKSSANAKEASATVDELRNLCLQLQAAYFSGDTVVGEALFQRLAGHFSCDESDGITSYELLKSETVETLLALLSTGSLPMRSQIQATFLRAFMVPSKARIATGTTESPTTAFTILVHKLQDLLSRTEHFEVITVHHNAFENSRNSATSMLAKQIRLRLTADEDSGITQPYRNIMVTIHAIAKFKALDEYLRPRLSLADMPGFKRSRRSLPTATSAVASGDGSSESRAVEASGSSRPNAQDANTTTSAPRTPDQSRTQRASRHKRSTQNVPKDSANSTRTEPQTRGQDSPLECADEETLTDEDAAAGTGMETILDDIDDAMDEDDTEDASAVNLEIAKSGKVEARKEDGTRIATPQGSQQPSAAALASMSASARLAAARELLNSPASLLSRVSYASAVQSVPQDWHIEFSIDGQVISNDTTIYRAIHFNQAEADEVSNRVVWSTIHKISFKKVPGPPPPEARMSTPVSSPSDEATGLPRSLSHHPRTANILQLMSLLHEINSDMDAVETSGLVHVPFSKEPLSQFINTKLTAKLNRQLEEPLIVASNCLPTWSEDLARLYPFLFPFESRYLFLQSTSFGYSRSMARWQNGQTETQSRRQRDERPFLGRTQRQKVRISRTRILESALKVMEMYGNSPSILEVEYFEEVGTGLGPTLEFYATISKEFSKKKLKLWRENESEATGEFAFGINGLFPAPMSPSQVGHENNKRVLHLFKLLGVFVARSMMDSRIIDISFNPLFFRAGLSAEFVPTLAMVSLVDKSLASSLRDLMSFVTAKRKIDEDLYMNRQQKDEAYQQIRIRGARVEDLGLDFTLPGYPHIELEEQGAKKDVTIHNLKDYIIKAVDLTVGSGVRRQIAAFKSGFTQVFPYTALKAFTPDELVMLFGRNEEDWTLETLMDSIKADHGFNLDSQSVRNLLQTMSEYTAPERRDFLQFVTGSPKLPIGGFKSLTPMFTVVCKPSEPPLTPDDYLPSVMTCVNYLKMPNYTSAETLRSKLAVAIKEGQGAFHLS